VGTNLYTIQTNLTGEIVTVLKSSDGGLTWVPKDTAGAPPIGSIAVVNTFCLGGTNLYFVGIDATSTFIQVSTFSTTSDTWVNNVITTNANEIGGLPMSVFYRPGDQVLVIASTLVVALNVLNPAYFTYNTVANTYSAWVPCGIQSLTVSSQILSVVAGAGTSVIMVYQGAQQYLYYQTLTTGGTLGAATQFTPTVVTVPVIFNASSNGTTISALWQRDQTVGQLEVWTAPVSTLSFSNQTVNLPAGAVPAPVAGVEQSNALYVFALVTVGSVYTLQLATDTGSGLGAFVVLGTDTISDGVWTEIWPNSLGVSTPWAVVINKITIAGGGATFETDYWASSFGPPPPTPPAPALFIPTPLSVILPNPRTACCPSHSRRCQTRQARKYSSKVIVYADSFESIQL
jgi:hypothetical protein